jgi:hypothetical protein
MNAVLLLPTYRQDTPATRQIYNEAHQEPMTDPIFLVLHPVWTGENSGFFFGSHFWLSSIPQVGSEGPVCIGHNIPHATVGQRDSPEISSHLQ